MLILLSITHLFHFWVSFCVIQKIWIIEINVNEISQGIWIIFFILKSSPCLFFNSVSFLWLIILFFIWFFVVKRSHLLTHFSSWYFNARPPSSRTYFTLVCLFIVCLNLCSNNFCLFWTTLESARFLFHICWKHILSNLRPLSWSGVWLSLQLVPFILMLWPLLYAYYSRLFARSDKWGLCHLFVFGWLVVICSKAVVTHASPSSVLSKTLLIRIHIWSTNITFL